MDGQSDFKSHVAYDKKKTNFQFSQNPILTFVPQTKDSLISLLQYSLDSFTHALLCDSTDDADKETRNALTSLNGDVFSLNCWANLSCNPRFGIYRTQMF